jgi:hypothetical protein
MRVDGGRKLARERRETTQGNPNLGYKAMYVGKELRGALGGFEHLRITR